MAQFLLRVIVAVLACVLLNALLPLVLHAIGFEIGGDALQIIRLCIGALAIVYIIWGRPLPIPWRPGPPLA